MILTILLLVHFVNAGPVVNTKFGPVEGFVFNTRTNTSADIFLNIPYAEAPVGDLRFEKPQPSKGWTGKLNATAFGPSCYPHASTSIIGPTSEDCLQLNIIRPSNATKGSNLPVLFWVHGGGYEIGSAQTNNYTGFANIYAPQNLVVVVIQYRLGFLGFLSTGTSEIPGNLGLWDQTEALRWVSQNIDVFGGNPKHLIPWGLSAGGGSVSALSISPHSRDLVHSTIEHSGSAFGGYTYGYLVSNRSMEFAQILGCGNNTKACLKKKTVTDMLAAVDKMGKAKDSISTMLFEPRFDGDFFPQTPHELLKDAPPKPTLVSMTRKEATTFTTFGALPDLHKFSVDLNKTSQWNRDKFMKRVKTLLVNEDNFGSNTKAALKEVMNFYIDGVYRENEDSQFFVDQYTKFITDTFVDLPVLEGIEAKRNAGWPLYMYRLNHANDVIYPKGFPAIWKGAPHASDWAYLCETFFFGTFDLYSGQELNVTMAQQNNVIQFAKTGKALFSDVGKEENVRYFDVTTKPQLKSNPFAGVLEFYKQLRKYGFDVITLTPIAKDKKTSEKEIKIKDSETSKNMKVKVTLDVSFD